MDEKDLKNNEEKENPQSQPPSEIDKRIRQLADERDEYLNGWKRAKADLINFQKEETRRLEDMARFGTEALIREVISVISSFEFALQTLEKAGPAHSTGSGQVDKGIYMIKSQLEDILKRRGVEKIKVAVGEVFNPAYHEAIGMVEPAENLKSDTVAEEVEAGYKMHDRVIRVSKVKVVR